MTQQIKERKQTITGKRQDILSSPRSKRQLTKEITTYYKSFVQDENP